MRLSRDDVSSAAASLSGRAVSAIERLENQKTFLGGVMGNNATVNSTQGAIRMILESQIPRWKQNGFDIIDSDNDSKVDGWLEVGNQFAKAITEIDGYGEDATLASVGRATIKQSVEDAKEKIKEAAPFLGIGLGVVVIVALAVIAIKIA